MVELLALPVVVPVLYALLVCVVVCVGLKTDDPERRKFALAILRILNPSVRRRRLPPGSS